MSARDSGADSQQHGKQSAEDKDNLPDRGDGSRRTETLNESDYMETTRRFPRTLEEAFPDKVKQSEWFYAPKKEIGVLEALVWIVVVLSSLGLLLWGAT